MASDAKAFKIVYGELMWERKARIQSAKLRIVNSIFLLNLRLCNAATVNISRGEVQTHIATFQVSY